MSLWVSYKRVFWFGCILILVTSGHGDVLRACTNSNLITVLTLRESLTNDHVVKVDGLRIHYVESGSGRPVVLIHGNAGSVEDFEGRTLSLLSAHYRVLAIDRPGHGRSDRPAR